MRRRSVILGTVLLLVLAAGGAAAMLFRGPTIDYDALPTQLEAIIESNQPRQVRNQRDEPNAYARLMELGSTTDRLHARFNIERPWFGALHDPLPEDTSDDIALARSVLDAYAAAGIFDGLAALSQMPRAVRPLPDGPLVDFVFSESGSYARNLSRALVARMLDQLAAGEQAGALRSYESMLALTRVLEMQSTSIDLMVARAIAAYGDSQIRAAITRGSFDDASLGEARDILLRQTAHRPTASRFLEVEQIFAFDALRERLPPFRVGTAIEIEDFFDAAFSLAEATRAERAADPELHRLADYIRGIEQPDALLDANSGLPDVLNLLWTYDWGTTDTNGTLIMIALERHRLATGVYPDSLEALPEAAALAAASPWPLIYRRTDEGYTLYAPGEDGVDNGGKPHPKVEVQALLPGNTGTDYVIH